jgi:hypothetical protein
MSRGRVLSSNKEQYNILLTAEMESCQCLKEK